MTPKKRITKRDLNGIADNISDLFGELYIMIEYAYGSPRALLVKGSKSKTASGTIVKELSPRMPAGELYKWLNAFREGIWLTRGERRSTEAERERYRASRDRYRMAASS